MSMKLFVLLILAVFTSEKKSNAENSPENEEKFGNNSILVKIEDDGYAKVSKKSEYIGVYYHKNTSKWCVQRKNGKRSVYNGYYDDEETAAHASDTLARKLMENDEKKQKLNFPDNCIEVYPKKDTYIGVTYDKSKSKWIAQRWSKHENTMVYNGGYDDEEISAHASDTLARKLMENGNQKLKLNFPGDHIEVYREEKKISKFIGVSFIEKTSKWRALRWSKNENKTVSNGCYDDEETAAHASDILARKLMEDGEQKHKFNFTEDDTEVSTNQKKKRKRPKE